MTNAIVDCRKQHPQQMTTIMGTLGGFIRETYAEMKERENKVQIKNAIKNQSFN
jgi:hypothetical protein